MSESRARYTSEEAVNQIGNRYNLILIASIRARELKSGHLPKITSNSGPVTTALQEIESGKIGVDYLKRLKEPKPRRY